MRVKKESDIYVYIGNCGDSFDKDGNCKHHLFRDVSDFAYYAELSEDEMEVEDREGNGEIEKDEFLSLVGIDQVPKKLRNKMNRMRYYSYSNGALVIYDPAKDIHYFFTQ